MASFGISILQVVIYFESISNIVVVYCSSFVFFFKMQKRERAWMISLTAMWLCLGALLMILLNPTPDKASADLIKVFLCSSHTIVACLIGYGLALTAAFMATHYQKFRLWGLAGGIIAVLLAVLSLWDATGKHYFGPAGVVGFSELPGWIVRAFAPNQFGLPIYANLVLVAIAREALLDEEVAVEPDDAFGDAAGNLHVHQPFVERIENDQFAKSIEDLLSFQRRCDAEFCQRVEVTLHVMLEIDQLPVQHPGDLVDSVAEIDRAIEDRNPGLIRWQVIAI